MNVCSNYFDMAILTASQQEISYFLDTLFPQFELELRQQIVEHGIIQHVGANHIIAKPGQKVRSLTLIVEGLVKVFQERENGDEFFLYHLSAGQVCTLRLLCNDQLENQDITKQTVDASTLIAIPLQTVDTLINRYDSWNTFLVNAYRSRFRELLDALSNMAFNGLGQRLENYLEKQVKSYKSNQLHITHEGIARDINTSRVVVSRLLKQMQDAGKLKLHRNYIELSLN